MSRRIHAGLALSVAALALGCPGRPRPRGAGGPARGLLPPALHHWTLQLARRGPSGSDEAQLTPEQCENLKALGYIQSECR